MTHLRKNDITFINVGIVEDNDLLGVRPRRTCRFKVGQGAVILVVKVAVDVVAFNLITGLKVGGFNGQFPSAIRELFSRIEEME